MSILEILKEFEDREKSTRFDRAVGIATFFFGIPRIRGAHYIFKTPWKGKPIVNIPKPHRGANIKPRYVKDLVKALKKLTE